MAVDPDQLRIVIYPDPVLRRRAQPVPQVTDEVRAVAQRMLQLMHEAPGVGLAAPQVGLSWRLFVANTTGEPANDQVYINPQLSNPSRDLEDYEEGCLSLPDIRAEIRRPRTMTITATGLDGQTFELTNSELLARVWQHEYDHLDGVLILDRMGHLDKLANRKALRQLEQA